MIGELQLEVDRPDVTVSPCRRPHWKGRTCVVDGDIGNATWTGRGRGKRTVFFVATRKGHAPKPSSDDSHPRTGRDRGKRSVRLLRGNTKRTGTAPKPIPEGSHPRTGRDRWTHIVRLLRGNTKRTGTAPKPIPEGSHPRTGRERTKRTVSRPVATQSGYDPRRGRAPKARIAIRTSETTAYASQVATPGGHRAQAELRGLASATPTGQLETEHRADSRNGRDAPRERRRRWRHQRRRKRTRGLADGDFNAPLPWWRHRRNIAPRLLEGGTHPRPLRRGRTKRIVC